MLTWKIVALRVLHSIVNSWSTLYCARELSNAQSHKQIRRLLINSAEIG